ncbi:hypothetical protein EZ449_00220 [Pedobacter frigidisoli]|uniref:Uncharacterized protein n=1 Tax=Pedobacter frigidisoli TaxID=2530455 RepID=A0A4R0P6G6_9SPHI|nr:hypothetical protein [Pedobacter frigidisoli]TCD12511.1 hypothetical protein EZ449_00220 [Pedobacter frigidisoli]
MNSNTLTKSIFYLTILSAFYLLATFIGLFSRFQQNVVFGAITELITIPAILVVVAAFLFTVYQLAVKHKEASFYLIATVLLSLSAIIPMFFVQ